MSISQMVVLDAGDKGERGIAGFVAYQAFWWGSHQVLPYPMSGTACSESSRVLTAAYLALYTPHCGAR